MDSGSDSKKTKETKVEAASTEGQSLKRKRSESILSETEVTQLDPVNNNHRELPSETGMKVNEPESDSDPEPASPMEMSLELPSRMKVMNNNLVMQSIAQKLSAGRLLGLRETCALWNSNFIPQLKKKHSMIRLDKFFTSPGPHMARFLQVIRASQGIPFTKYFFDVNDDPTHYEEDMDCFFEFIQTYGNTLTKLELHWVENTDLEISQLRRIIFHHTPELVELELIAGCIGPTANKKPDENEPEVKLLPKLRHLCVAAPELAAGRVDSTFINFLEDVIWNAQGLESLELLGGGRGTHKSSDDLIGPILDGLIKIPHLNKIKRLKLNSFITNHVKVLSDLATTREDGILLSLHSLHIIMSVVLGPGEDDDDDDDDEDELELLYTFLTMQSPTLKKLDISFEIFDEQQIELCSIPRMGNLTKLKIQHSTLGTDQLQFTKEADGKFVDSFPKLQQFSYEYDPGIDLEDIPQVLENVHRLYHPGVTAFKLKISMNNYATFSTFGHILPSLTHLDLILTASDGDDEEMINWKELGKIWTTWPELTVVRINFNVKCLDIDVDALVSGIPRAGLEHLRHNMDFTSPIVASDSEKYKTRPAISDLKHLQEFIIRFGGKDNNDHLRPRLTDMGGYLGVALASPTLQHLVIQGNGQNLVSEPCLAFIRKRFGPCAVIEL